jgi:hypothetical protein
MEEMTNVKNILAGKSEGKRSLERYGYGRIILKWI